MRRISEETAINEWVKFYKVFESVGLNEFYDLDKLKEELFKAPCALSEDSGTAYKGALLLHINMFIAIAQRIAKMISGTFEINEQSLLKVCCIMHLAKRYMYVENTNEWEINNRNIFFKFAELDGCLKCGERSALEALSNGVKLTPIELEAIKALDNLEENIKNPYLSILTLIVRQANELSYAIEKERYKKISEK